MPKYNKIESFLRPGEHFIPSTNYAIGTASQSPEEYRIGIAKYPNSKFARVRIPQVIWDWEHAWVRVVVRSNDKTTITAFLIARTGPDTPEHEKVVIKRTNGAGCPYFKFPVSSESKMRGNRYPKQAASLVVDNVTRVDVPGTVELKLDLEG
jgi:hypothetical protein